MKIVFVEYILYFLSFYALQKVYSVLCVCVCVCVLFFLLNFQEERNRKKLIKLLFPLIVLCIMQCVIRFRSIFFLSHCKHKVMLPSFDRCIDETQEKKHLDCSSLYGYWVHCYQRHAYFIQQLNQNSKFSPNQIVIRFISFLFYIFYEC